MIKPEHLKLLARANWKFNESEYGAPEIDCKRPYGNSDVEEDIADILGWKVFLDKYDEKHISKEQMEEAHKLHRELVEVIPEIIKIFTESYGRIK